MKKLKIKVFFVIFSLLTIFTLIIFAGSTIRDYMEKRRSVSDVLTRIPKTYDNNEERKTNYLMSIIKVYLNHIY